MRSREVSGAAWLDCLPSSKAVIGLPYFTQGSSKLSCPKSQPVTDHRNCFFHQPSSNLLEYSLEHVLSIQIQEYLLAKIVLDTAENEPPKFYESWPNFAEIQVGNYCNEGDAGGVRGRVFLDHAELLVVLAERGESHHGQVTEQA